MATDFHPVGLREQYDRVRFAEVERGFILPDRSPLHRILGFDHVEFSGKRCRVGSLGK